MKTSAGGAGVDLRCVRTVWMKISGESLVMVSRGTALIVMLKMVLVTSNFDSVFEAGFQES